ncbi:MAG TPA: hypothetical protein VH114_14170 [Candidatus Acidoferrum sp.]|jgi:hypothetical protein|nr:hypothetical protein [Candidatus Acidoferrum sp.]
MNLSPGLAREEVHNMVLRGDENKRQVDGSSGAEGGKRYRGAAVPAVPDGENIPAVDICNWQLVARLAENV